MKPSCILIPFHNPWDWHTDYTNQTARILSRHHTVVCFLWGDAVSLWELLRRKHPYRPIRKSGNLWKFQPLFLFPGKRIVAAQFINIFFNLISVHILCSILSFRQSRQTILWFFGFFDPVFLVIPPFFRYWKTIYDYVDIASHPDPFFDRLIRTSDIRVLRHAWIVVTNSRTLERRIRSIRPDVVRVPLGFRMKIFKRPAPYAISNPNRLPIIGYLGSIDYRLNVPLLLSLVDSHPRWQFAIFGPVFHDHLTQRQIRDIKTLLTRKNVIHDTVNPETIPSVLAQCSAVMIPYLLTIPLSKYAFPMKIMEYFYAQKPVISTPLAELLQFDGLIRFARTEQEWSKGIRHALAYPLTAPQKRQSQMIARSHSWDKKIAAIAAIMATRQTRLYRIKDFPYNDHVCVNNPIKH